MASPMLKEKQQPVNGIPDKPPGRACPAPTARRWASPMPSINAHGGVKTPPYGRPISAYVNYIRRAGCPHPAASSRGYRSTGSHLRRGRRPRRPGNLLPPPTPGKTPGPGMPGPTEGSRPLPTNRPINECPPPTARRCGNGDKKTEAIPFPGTASVLYISI